MLGTIKFVDKSVNDNGASWLDHCDVIALRSGFGVPTGVPHSEVELQTEFKSFTSARLGPNTNQHADSPHGGTCIKSSRSVYTPYLVQSVRLNLFNYLGSDNAHWISKNEMAAMAVHGDQCGTNFRVNIANLWVSCYNGNNDTVCSGVVRPAPSGAGRMITSKPSLRSGFDCIICPAPEGAGRTTPSQPAHYPLTIICGCDYMSSIPNSLP